MKTPNHITYWESVAEQIEKKFDKGHPKNWNQEEIQIFLHHFEEKLAEIVRKDPQKAALCGVPFVKGRYEVRAWQTISPSTFRKIFQYKKSAGKVTTKNQFAIYLGHPSFAAYANSLDITFPEKKKPATTHQKERFRKISLLTTFRWMMAWLVVSALMHNVIGIIKGDMRQHLWCYLFWIPAVVIGIFGFYISKHALGRTTQKLQLISMLWWTSIFSLMFFNQFLPNWIHLVQFAGLFWIGIIGQLSISTRLVFLAGSDIALFNHKYRFIAHPVYNINVALVAYLFGLCFGLLFVAIMWVIPSSLLDQYSNDSWLFRSYATIEMILSFLLISAGYRKLVFNPIFFLNTRQG